MNNIQNLSGSSSPATAYRGSSNGISDMAQNLLTNVQMGRGSYDAAKIVSHLEKVADTDPALSNAIQTEVMQRLSVVEQGQFLAAKSGSTTSTKPGSTTTTKPDNVVVFLGSKEAVPVRATGKPIPISETHPHKIKKGDTLASIMKQHGLTQADLNNLILANPGKILYSDAKGFHINMKPGEVLNIPDVREKPLPPLPTK
jgi:LysM repeat protein